MAADGLVLLAAGLAFGLAALGTAIGEGIAASSAIAAVSENEKMFTKSLILVGIVETSLIFGLVLALIMIFAL
ncbi:MAG: V-type ATP synthase subunit K [Nanoarchaeota archaeon]